MKKIFFFLTAMLLLIIAVQAQHPKPQHPALISIFLAEIDNNELASNNGIPQTASAATEEELHAIIRKNKTINHLTLIEKFRNEILTGLWISWIPEKEVLSSPTYKALSSDITLSSNLANDAPAGYYAIMNFDKKAIKKSFEINSSIDAVATAMLKFEMRQESRVMDQGKLKIECSGYLTFFDNTGKKKINIKSSEKSAPFAYSYRNGFEQAELNPFMEEAMNKVIAELKSEFVKQVQ